MPGITLDIETKVIESTQNIWAMFPGEGRKFFGQFATEKVVFLDAPGLNLTPDTFANDDLLRQHVAMSHAIAEFHVSRGKNPPNRSPRTYPVRKNASFNAAVGNVQNVYKWMKRGDLVLVGDYSYYAPILIGEIAAPFDQNTTVTYPSYPREKIPARKVKWLNTRRERRYLSQSLPLLLSNRKAVITINKELYGEEIYKQAYGDYVFGTDSRYIFPGPKYNNIARSLSPGIDLISYFIAAFHALELKELEKFSALDIPQAIDSYIKNEDLISFTVDFSSPGEYVLHARRAVLALLVASLVAATSDTTLPYNEARAAEITNSAGGAAAADPQLVPIQGDFKSIMDAVGADMYNQLCVINKECQDKVGLKTGVKIKGKKAQ